MVSIRSNNISSDKIAKKNDSYSYSYLRYVMTKSPGGLSLSWLENLARVTLTGGLTYYGLSVASIPSLVPPAFSFMVGIYGGILALMLPKQLFILGAVIPMVYTTILAILFAASLLLCAVSVSDGLFIVVFFIYSIWCSSLFFGPQYDKISGNVSTLTGPVGSLYCR